MDSPGAPLQSLAAPTEVRLPLPSAELATLVPVGQQVMCGQPLATGAKRDTIHAPITGEVTGIGGIRAASGEDLRTVEVKQPPGVEDVWMQEPTLEDPRAAEPEDLLEALSALGIVLPWQAAGVTPRTVIIMGVDREPGLGVQAHFVTEGQAELAEAIEGLGRIADGARLVLAVPAGQEGQVSGVAGLEILPVVERYPDSHWRLILARAAGVGNITPEGAREAGVFYVTAEHLCLALRAVKTGRPRTTKYLTVTPKGGGQPTLVEVPVGTPVGHVLEQLEIKVEEGDRILLGGIWQGNAQFDLGAPVTLGTDGLTLIAAGEVTALTENPCINCGRCVQICPVNIQVSLVARHAEFALAEEAYVMGASACIECGACAFVCPARRPLVQYMRYAIDRYGQLQAEALAEADALAAAEAETIE